MKTETKEFLQVTYYLIVLVAMGIIVIALAIDLWVVNLWQ